MLGTNLKQGIAHRMEITRHTSTLYTRTKTYQGVSDLSLDNSSLPCSGRGSLRHTILWCIWQALAIQRASLHALHTPTITYTMMSEIIIPSPLPLHCLPIASFATILKVPQSADRIKSPQECHHQFLSRKQENLQIRVDEIEGIGSTNKSSSGGSDGSEGSCLCDGAGGCTCGCCCRRQAPTEGRNAAGCHCWSGHFDAPVWVGRWRDCAPNPPRTIATWDDGGCECLRMGGGMLGRGGRSEWATARQPVSSDSWLWPQLLATPPLRLINNLDYPSLPCPWIIFLLSSPSACLKPTPHQLYNGKKEEVVTAVAPPFH